MREYITSILNRSIRLNWGVTHPKALILLYHRVVKLDSDPQLLSVTEQHFAEHLEHIQKHYYPMSLVELSHILSEKKHVPLQAVIITFDDGYADNHLIAKPLLKQYNVPATVFIITGFIGSNQEFWWDELERLLLLSESLPDSLTLTFNNNIYSWKMQSQDKSNSINPEKYRYWNVTMNETPTPRHKAYRELCNLLRPLDHHARQKILEDLAQWTGIKNKIRADYRALSADEVHLLADGGLIEIGSHTQTHPVLKSLSSQDQIKEIEESKKCLEVITGQRVTSFSYPYGTHSDYTKATIANVKDSGFSCACSNFTGVIRQGTDCFQLPRFIVRDWDGDEFARRLKEWFHG